MMEDLQCLNKSLMRESKKSVCCCVELLDGCSVLQKQFISQVLVSFLERAP